MGFKLVFSCNGCGLEYTTETYMDFPPHWLAMQLAISNEDGQIPEHEQNLYMHFCSQKCFGIYGKSDELKERILLVDSDPGDTDESDGSNTDDDDTE